MIGPPSAGRAPLLRVGMVLAALCGVGTTGYMLIGQTGALRDVEQHLRGASPLARGMLA